MAAASSPTRSANNFQSIETWEDVKPYAGQIVIADINAEKEAGAILERSI